MGELIKYLQSSLELIASLLDQRIFSGTRCARGQHVVNILYPIILWGTLSAEGERSLRHQKECAQSAQSLIQRQLEEMQRTVNVIDELRNGWNKLDRFNYFRSNTITVHHAGFSVDNRQEESGARRDEMGILRGTETEMAPWRR